MSIRTTFVLLVVLLLVAGYFLFAESKPSTTALQQGQDAPWFYTAAMEDIRHITIQTGAAKAAFFQTEPGSWFFDEPKDLPVDLARWGGVTLLLGGPQTRRLIADTVERENTPSFGLDKPSTTIDVALTGDRKLRILLGATTPNGVSHYAMREGDPRLYLVDASWGQVLTRLALEPPYPEWFWKVPPQRVRFLAVTHGEKTVQFTQEFSGEWRFATDERTPVDEARWKSVLPALAGPPSLRVLEQKIDDFGKFDLLKPAARITVEVEPPRGIEESRRSIQLEVGGRLSDGSGYYAKMVGFPLLLFVDAPWYDTMLGLALDPPIAKKASGS